MRTACGLIVSPYLIIPDNLEFVKGNDEKMEKCDVQSSDHDLVYAAKPSEKY